MTLIPAAPRGQDLAPTEVWLVTGFLGSGKTTFLRELAAQSAPGDLALIINEFAELGIDQQLLRGGDDDFVLLSGGCVCCEVKDDLVDALHRLHARRKQEGGPQFRR